MARIAKALATLREQVNTKWPNRSNVNDGWLGDSDAVSSLVMVDVVRLAIHLD